MAGRDEALQAAKALQEHNKQFDIVFTSLLKRANESLDIILKQLKQTDLPVVRAWQLNERHYGELTGYNKAEMAEKYGIEQVTCWQNFLTLPNNNWKTRIPFFIADKYSVSQKDVYTL